MPFGFRERNYKGCRRNQQPAQLAVDCACASTFILKLHK